MAKQRSTPPQEEPKLKMSKADAQHKLDDRLTKGREFLAPQVRMNWAARVKDYEKWTIFNETMLRQMFTTDALAVEYNWSTNGSVSFQLGGYPEGPQHRWENVQPELDCLESIGERLDLYADPQIERADSTTGLGPTALPPSPLKKLETLANRFHVVARHLRDRPQKRTPFTIADEYDVQYLLHALLVLEFEDVRAEECAPSYAGGTSRMDFLLRRERVVIEVKHTRDGLGSKEVGDQLAIDIVRYRSHPDCGTLFCFVYDPEGRVRNPRGIEDDLSHDTHGLPTLVRIRPQ
jgi:REase_DpnII-MboI